MNRNLDAKIKINILIIIVTFLFSISSCSDKKEISPKVKQVGTLQWYYHPAKDEEYHIYCHIFPSSPRIEEEFNERVDMFDFDESNKFFEKKLENETREEVRQLIRESIEYNKFDRQLRTGSRPN